VSPRTIRPVPRGDSVTAEELRQFLGFRLHHRRVGPSIQRFAAEYGVVGQKVGSAVLYSPEQARKVMEAFYLRVGLSVLNGARRPSSGNRPSR
jgi:hypothetical protein